MAKYKNGTYWNEDFFNHDTHGHQMYWGKYYDYPDYFHHTEPNFALRYSAVGRRSHGLSSSNLDPRDQKQSSSISKSRIAIIIAAIVTICAIIAAIIVAVYFTSIPGKRSNPKATITNVEVSRLKTYQGEVGLAKEWNENLTDPDSPLYKQEANNFVSAMDQIYGYSPYKNRYKGTVVDGFRNGSIFVRCRIFWTGIYIQEIDSSSTSINGQEGQVISQVEINPLDTENLIKLIKDQLPDLLGTNLTATPVLQVVMTTIAPVTTGKPSTTAPKTTTSNNSTQKTLNQMTSQPTITTRIVIPPEIITNTGTPTTLMPSSTTTTATQKTNTNTTTTPNRTSTTLNSTANTEATTTQQTAIVTTISKSTTAIATSNPPTTNTDTSQISIESTTTLKSTTARTTMSIPSTTTTSNPTYVSTATWLPSITTITISKPPMTSTTTTPKPTTNNSITPSNPATSTATSTISNTTTENPITTSMMSKPATTSSRTTSTPATTSTETTQIPGSTSTTTLPKSFMPSTTTTTQPTTSVRPELTTAPNINEQLDSVTCQFENIYQCGYRNLHLEASWDQRSGNFFKMPPYDHTYGNETGRFMAAYNSSGLEVYYNQISLVGPEYPYRIEYLNALLSSPRKNFMSESCVYFYYYLNGTAIRPNPLSAQLYVYVNGSGGRRLEWYDHVNRTINGWLKGWVPLQPGYANIIFQARTVTTTTVWPGVVALDDVSVIAGSCPSYPDCGSDTFRCATTRVCISVYLQCDGNNDCIDGSDEENCISKPDYQVKLINGDGSYGSIAIFYQGLWRPVCMPKFSMMEGNSTIVRLACKKLGYIGRFQSAFANSRGGFVNSWHHPVEFAMKISCNYDQVDISNCSMNLTRTEESTISCYYYQAAFCSHDDCFSGERLCPTDNTNANHSFNAKCISKSYFCDGIPDCPGGTDEFNCANCSTSEFECTNHECIPASQRCDGTPQCGDKSDEYGCVIVTNNRSQIFHSHLSAYLPVCFNNTSIVLANILCSLSGQGSSTYYQSTTYGKGTVLTAHSNATTSLVPGYTMSIEPCFHLLLHCASIECGTTLFDDNKLPKILHGRDAVLGQLPWQIALYKNGFFACGGSIIHPNWVLTAAHCTKDLKPYSGRVGEVEVGSVSSEGYRGNLYSSSRTHIHPFHNRDDDNDISLLYFSQPIVYSDYVRPICIASKRTTEEILNTGFSAECYISGWGANQDFMNRELWSGKLQMVRVQLYQKEECDQMYYNAYKMYPQNITVCVDNQNFGSPSCSGDSGSPLICRNKYGRFEVLGMLSWGYGSCFKDGYPDIYQLAYPHADWITQITGLAFSDLTMDMD
ncbi:hypothetical protein CHS0354_026895 [Potamilus streckersoni]|uniref:Uncharacterized protein n=1 Tax=Potamilus streckersoni TaxID=2493646 RepID=A0AAE0VYT2_9BIVA|nr:hypothetical protein CHS0354_026895 [Potamilus streckersoni]